MVINVHHNDTLSATLWVSMPIVFPVIYNTTTSDMKIFTYFTTMAS